MAAVEFRKIAVMWLQMVQVEKSDQSFQPLNRCDCAPGLRPASARPPLGTGRTSGWTDGMFGTGDTSRDTT